MITQYSKEMYDAIDYFKRNVSKVAYVSASFDMEDKTLWKKGFYFKNGDINNLFKVFMMGESYGYNIGKEEQI